MLVASVAGFSFREEAYADTSSAYSGVLYTLRIADSGFATPMESAGSAPETKAPTGLFKVKESAAFTASNGRRFKLRIRTRPTTQYTQTKKPNTLPIEWGYYGETHAFNFRVEVDVIEGFIGPAPTYTVTEVLVESTGFDWEGSATVDKNTGAVTTSPTQVPYSNGNMSSIELGGSLGVTVGLDATECSIAVTCVLMDGTNSIGGLNDSNNFIYGTATYRKP